MAGEEAAICVVPEPSRLKFTGRWLMFDGVEDITDFPLAEFNIGKGGWRIEKIERDGQGVSIDEGCIKYWGNRFTALATIIQLILQSPGRLPEVYIEERQDFSFRCFHLDIARGGIPTIRTFRRLVKWLFLLKYTHFAVYVEDLFPWKRYGNVGRDHGKLTDVEFEEMCGYGERMGIEVFPSLELLGHMEHVLSLPEYHDYSELWWRSDDCIDLTNPHARGLAMGMLEDALEVSRSRHILVGGDETWSLGRGRSLDRLGKYMGPELYVEHYRSIIDKVRGRGRTPVLWGDMLTGMYLADEGRKIWEKVVGNDIWNDVVVANWDYSPEEKAHFKEKISSIGRFEKQLACPGLSNWLTFYPDFDAALKNLEMFLSAARESGLKGYVITAWGDGGSECLFSLLDPLILAAAEIANGGNGWKGKWLALTGEKRSILDSRLLLGGRGLGRKLRHIIQNAGEGVGTDAGELETWKSLYRETGATGLPEDVGFARDCLGLAIDIAEGTATRADFFALADRFAGLWRAERKEENLDRVIGNLWSSAAKFEIAKERTAEAKRGNAV